MTSSIAPFAYQLGIDLGSTSIGWAMIPESPEDCLPDDPNFAPPPMIEEETLLPLDQLRDGLDPATLAALEADPLGMFPIRAGIRIFPEGVDRETSGVEFSRMQDRRAHRLMRRQHDRKARRKIKLANELVHARLLPPQGPARAELFRQCDTAHLQPETAGAARCLALNFGPYALRRRALDESISPYEFGRILMHLNQRRGFLSNRKERKAAKAEKAKESKAATAEKEKETQNVLSSIEQIREGMKQSSARTYGEFLVFRAQKAAEPMRNRIPKTLARWPERKMLLEEYEALWNAQAPHHPALLTPKLRERLREVIFFQRPLKSAKELIGPCALDPAEKRAPRSAWLFFQFRLYKEMNNLRVIDGHSHERTLTPEEHGVLAAELTKTRDVLKWEKMKKVVKLPHSDTQTFNLEREKTLGLKGNWVEWALREVFSPEIFTDPRFHERAELLRGPIWDAACEAAQSGDEKAEAAFHRQCAESWDIPGDQAEQLLDRAAEAPEGHARLSLKAMRRLLPFLEQGDDEYTATQKAGFNDSAALAQAHALLPAPPGDIPNPIVRTALTELRKVVNLLIQTYGKPTRIVIELARETKGTSGQRNDRLKENRKREKNRDKIADELKELKGGIPPTGHDIKKYLLWQECKQDCPYTGKHINLTDLFGPNPQFDIEHILPYSRSLDNSMMNLTLAHKSVNAQKKDMTPFEAFHGGPEWDGIERRLLAMRDTMPWRKRQRFQQKELKLDDFIARQLNDTQYASREARKYLQSLGIPVDCTRGQVTSELRHVWGLNAILADDGENAKNRTDHRHHAIDAAVIALTTPRHLQRLARKSDFKQPGRRSAFPLPWPAFRRDLQRSIQAIKVSYRSLRNVRGGLHEETNYGPVDLEKGLFAYRKKLNAQFSANSVELIRDPHIREIVREWIQTHGGDTKTAFKNGYPTLPNRRGAPVPIRSVRITDKLGQLHPIHRPGESEPYTYVKTGANHHISIFEYTDKKGRKKREGVVTSMLEAARRVEENKKRDRQGLPILPVITTQHPDKPEAQFLFSLSINEIVRISKGERPPELANIQSISGKKKNESYSVDLEIEKHYVAVSESVHSSYRIGSLDKTNIQKVLIDPIGREFPAHD